MSVADVFIPDPSTKKMIVVVRDMCRRQLSGRGKMHSTCWGKPKFWQDRLVKDQIDVSKLTVSYHAEADSPHGRDKKGRRLETRSHRDGA